MKKAGIAAGVIVAAAIVGLGLRFRRREQPAIESVSV